MSLPARADRPWTRWCLLLVLALSSGRLVAAPHAEGSAADLRFPESPFVIDVTRAPYSARGDGVTDDSAALQRALDEHVGRHHLLFLPRGTYLLSRTLTWPKRHAGHENWGKTMIRGESRDGTVLRLRDGVATNASRPMAMMWCGGFGSADWFHNYVEHLTFDVGGDNPGAIALQFYSNNSGAVRDCRFVAPPGSGAIGLDLGHRDMNGPLLVRRCEVLGFRIGVATSHAVNSQVFEHLTLRGQSDVGLENAGQSVSIRGLISEGAGPALRTYGSLAVLDADLTGPGPEPAKPLPAIINYNGGRLWARDIRTRGYARAIADVTSPDLGAALRVTGADKPGSQGPIIREYSSLPATRPFDSRPDSLRLPIRETPEAPWDPPASWANVDAFGADPTGRNDSTAAIQRAVDSGASTVFLPGSYRLEGTVVLRGRVHRFMGLGGAISYGRDVGPDLRLSDGNAPVVTIEHFSGVHGGLRVDSRRTLVLRSVSDCDLTPAPRAAGADWYFEDVVTHGLRIDGQRVWARQLNVENEGLHVVNEAGQLWVLGYKTERGGTLLETTRGGWSEILGGFSYTTTAGKLAPMFVNRDASVFAWFAEVCFNGDPFATLIQETLAGDSRVVRRGAGHTQPYVGVGTR